MKSSMLGRAILAAVVVLGSTACNAVLGIHELAGDDADATAPEDSGSTPKGDAGRDGAATDGASPGDGGLAGDSTLPGDSGADAQAPNDSGPTDARPTDAESEAEAGCGAGLVLCSGSCVSLASIHSCGACGNDCASLPNVEVATLTCSSGRCGYTCLPAYADCAGIGGGCATPLSSGPNCGGCGKTCPANTACSQADAGSYGCVSTCPAGAPTICSTGSGSQCVNLQTDNGNCGSCAAACTANTTCIGASCIVQLGVTRVTFSATQNVAFSGKVANVTDAIASDTTAALTALVDWGDGSSTAGSISAASGAFAVAGSHTYTSAGTYTVTVTVSDATTGAKGTSALPAQVGACLPNATQCVGTTQPQQCDSTGQWQNLAACTNGFTCSSGACSCSQTTCGSSCVNTSTDPQNCGQCGNACISCAAGHCQCVAPGGTSLVKNGGFDTNVANWTSFDTNIVLSWASLDAAQCSTSGSVLATNQAPNGLNSGFDQCVPVTAGQSYDVGAWIRTPSGGAHGQTFLQLNWFSGAGCTGTLTAGALISASGTFDKWELLSKDNMVAPSGTVSAQVYGQIIKNFTDPLPYQTYYDMMYLSPSPGHF
jgi:hypothetical protein